MAFSASAASSALYSERVIRCSPLRKVAHRARLYRLETSPPHPRNQELRRRLLSSITLMSASHVYLPMLGHSAPPRIPRTSASIRARTRDRVSRTLSVTPTRQRERRRHSSVVRAVYFAREWFTTGERIGDSAHYVRNLSRTARGKHRRTSRQPATSQRIEITGC